MSITSNDLANPYNTTYTSFTMNSSKHHQLLAPVALKHLQEDSVSHSLAILSTVYHYNHWIFDSLRDHIGPRVLEIGAGVGNITQFLLNHDQVDCLEPFETYNKYLTNRFTKHQNVIVHPNSIEDCPNSEVQQGAFDTVICINVLEHIEDDIGALRRMRQLVKPGGHVIILVPALNFIYGELDKAMGHHRRYSLGSLRRAQRQAGLKPKHGRYMNMVGALGWWWCGRIMKSTKIDEATTNRFDRLVPFLSAFERIVPTPFGQSVFLIGQAP